ncbi:MAG TPA: hypothetical protein ENJ97_06845 [Planctomycetes bacterium]|nr:hypothetical protein [Planctomycetota bacterium]
MLLALLCAPSCTFSRTVPLALKGNLLDRGPAHLVEGGYGRPLTLPPGLQVLLSGEVQRREGLGGKGPPTQALVFRLQVANRTGRNFTLLFPRFLVRDDSGRVMKLGQVLDAKGRPTLRAALGPGKRAAWLLVFPRPQGEPFRGNLGFTLHWAFRLGGEALPVASLFQAQGILSG